MLSGADFPTMLRRKELTDAVKLFDDDYTDQYPLNGLFDSKKANASLIRTEIIERLRYESTLRSKPRSADRNVFRQYGELLVSTFHLSEGFDIESTTFNALRLPRTSGSEFDQEARADAVEYLSESLSDRVGAIRRAQHGVKVKLFTEAAPEVTIDGDTVELDYGVTVESSGVDWRTFTEDVLVDFATLYNRARKQFRGRPTDLFISSSFWHTYVAPNQELREFFIRDQQSARGNIAEALAKVLNLPPEMKVTEIDDEVQSKVDDTVSDVWPVNIMTFARRVKGGFREYTNPTMENDNKGGLASYSYESNDPKGWHVVVSDNGIPVVRRPDLLMPVDLHAPGA